MKYNIVWFRHLPLSVFWHTSNVVLDVVSDVVNFSFFVLRKFWRCKRRFFLSYVNFDVCKPRFFFSYVNFDVVNPDFFLLRKFWRCKRHFFPNVHFDAV